MVENAERKRTALVVDDDPDFLYLMGLILKPKGYIVIPADNAEKFSKMFRKREAAKLPIDEVWADIRCPNYRDGIEAVLRLAGTSEIVKLGVVFMSGTMEDLTDDDISEITKRGWRVETLPRPFGLDRVARIVDKLRAKSPGT